MKPNWHHLQAIRDEDNDVDTVAIPMLSLDQICKEENIVPELLKIDVRGVRVARASGRRTRLAKCEDVVSGGSSSGYR
jgi:hypothetical protein